MSAIKPMTWAEFEAERRALGLSRAELLRRSGISETTMFKGLKAHEAWQARVDAGDRKAIRRGAPKPQLQLQGKLNRTLEMERAMGPVRKDADRAMRDAGLR